MQVKHFFLAGAIVIVAACNSSETTESTNDADSTGQSANNSFDASSAKSTVENNNRRFEDAMSKGDSTQVASLYSSDAWLMPPNHETVKGQNDIAGTWGSFIRMGVKGVKLTTDDVSGAGDVIAESGSYDILGAVNNSLDKGKYVVVWKKEGDDWKMHRDIWNSNQAPPGQ